jgi:hypothetical protein
MKEFNKLYCDISKLSIRPVNKSIAKDIIVTNHYSKQWTKVTYALGLFYKKDNTHKFFNGLDEELIGIICYGDPIGMNCGGSISDLLERDEVMELVRLFVFDGYGCNIESWFVGKSFEWLRENAKHIRALISYSDPSVGHAGKVYQATNWIYQKSIRQNVSYSFKWEENGKWQHGRTIAPYYGTTSPEKLQTILDKPFWVKVQPLKHRYIYILGKDKKDKKQLLKSLKHPAYEYPKTNTEFIEEIHKLEPIERVK